MLDRAAQGGDTAGTCHLGPDGDPRIGILWCGTRILQCGIRIWCSWGFTQAAGAAGMLIPACPSGMLWGLQQLPGIIFAALQEELEDALMGTNLSISNSRKVGLRLILSPCRGDTRPSVPGLTGAGKPGFYEIFGITLPRGCLSTWDWRTLQPKGPVQSFFTSILSPCCRNQFSKLSVQF